MGLRAEFIRKRMILDAVSDCLELNQLIADEIEKLGDARDQLLERAEVLLSKYDEMFPDRLAEKEVSERLPPREMPLEGPPGPASVSPSER